MTLHEEGLRPILAFLRLPEPLYTLDGIGYNQGKDVLAISIVELEKPMDFSALNLCDVLLTRDTHRNEEESFTVGGAIRGNFRESPRMATGNGQI